MSAGAGGVKLVGIVLNSLSYRDLQVLARNYPGIRGNSNKGVLRLELLKQQEIEEDRQKKQQVTPTGGKTSMRVLHATQQQTSEQQAQQLFLDSSYSDDSDNKNKEHREEKFRGAQRDNFLIEQRKELFDEQCKLETDLAVVTAKLKAVQLRLDESTSLKGGICPICVAVSGHASSCEGNVDCKQCKNHSKVHKNNNENGKPLCRENALHCRDMTCQREWLAYYKPDGGAKMCRTCGTIAEKGNPCEGLERKNHESCNNKVWKDKHSRLTCLICKATEKTNRNKENKKIAEKAVEDYEANLPSR
jgi:hypothetical protein